jgi:hypothetical protein
MSVKEICARTGNTEFATAMGLISLIQKGMVIPRGATVDEALEDLRQQVRTGVYH